MAYGTYAFNGYNTFNNSSFETGAGSISCPISVPNGRPDSSGIREILITALHPFFSGRGAPCNAQASIGGQSTAVFALPAGSSGSQQTLGITAYFLGAGVQTLTLSYAGPINFGRQAGVSGIDISEVPDAGGWSDSTIGGYFEYCVAATAPTITSVTPGPGGAVDVQVITSGDYGGLLTTGAVLQYATNSSFSGAGTIGVPSGGLCHLNLTPGVTYWFRAASRNQLTDHYGRYGAWSAVKSATMQSSSGGRIKTSATAFTPITAKIKTGSPSVFANLHGKIKTGMPSTWADLK